MKERYRIHALLALCPDVMSLRLLLGWTMVGLMLLIGSACSGPKPEASESTEDSAQSRTYLVQLRMTEEKEEANRSVGRALEWWRAHAPSMDFSLASTMEEPVTIAWKAPLYRVRLGPFASRSAAEKVREAVRPAFSNAFVVPSRRGSPQ